MKRYFVVVLFVLIVCFAYAQEKINAIELLTFPEDYYDQQIKVEGRIYGKAGQIKERFITDRQLYGLKTFLDNEYIDTTEGKYNKETINIVAEKQMTKKILQELKTPDNYVECYFVGRFYKLREDLILFENKYPVFEVKEIHIVSKHTGVVTDIWKLDEWGTEVIVQELNFWESILR